MLAEYLLSAKKEVGNSLDYRKYSAKDGGSDVLNLWNASALHGWCVGGKMEWGERKLQLIWTIINIMGILKLQENVYIVLKEAKKKINKNKWEEGGERLANASI